ncbi:hypothetical protein M9194_20560 [Vibrio sp. S4M6]|uniref:hypothetical protein n=1 Tax=Vibrio sinus TaxID=2946865 RepID=UPI00202A82D8|nr:hypothetical protein [Vibrio sinus]MCL9783822.1 hypothetical protein [Vibrio sinus]
MNPFKFPVSRLQECSYPGDIIPKTELEHLNHAQSVLDEARKQAQNIIAEAESELHQAKADIQQMRADARFKAEQEAVSIAQKETDQAIARTIEWIADEISLEQRVAANMGERIRTLVAQAVTEYCAQQDVSEILVRRLSRPIEEQLLKGNVQLKVNSQMLSAIELKLPKGNGLEIVADDSLSKNQACLETALLRMDLDLDLHLQSILDNLIGESKAQACNSY